MTDDLRVDVRERTAFVTLNRPDRRNAFDDVLAAAIAKTFDELSGDESVVAVVLAGEGSAFCAGGDLAWMRRAADYDEDQNLRDAAAFQRAFESISLCAAPVVARVHGAALGGGAGLVAACDIAIASEAATFGFPEVRLGLLPGVIAPYVVRAIGPREATRLFVTGERFDAAEARRIGLVHRVVPAAELDAAVERVLGSIREGSPVAVASAKNLVLDLEGSVDAEERLELARQAIADARASEQGREGVQAFLDGRRPTWKEPRP